jgi:putative ABC transport system permease protein
MLSLLRLVSLRHLRRHRLRTALTTLGIALGVAAVVAMGLVNESVTVGMRKTTEQVAGKAELVISGDRTGMPEDLLAKVRKVPGIRHATPVVKQVAAIKRVNGKAAGGMLQIYAVDALDDRSVPDSTFKKEDLELEDPILFLNQPSSLIVTRKFARRHGIEDQADKAKVAVTTSKGVLEFTVRGYLRSEGPEKVFGGNFALMDVYSAQKVFGKEKKFDEINVLLPADVTPEARDGVRAALAAAVGPGYDVERPLNRGRQAERLIATWQVGMSLVSLVTLFVGMFLIYNTVSVAVAERRREIGILRALGARRREIASLFAIEAVVMGAVGALLGVGGGIAMARGLLKMTSELLTMIITYTDIHEVQVPTPALVSGIAVGALAALASAVFPAIGASRVSPLEATRPTTQEPIRRRRAKTAAVLAFVCFGITAAGLLHPASRANEPLAFGTAIALLFGFVLLCPIAAPLLARAMAPVARALFGAMGRLAADNLVRSPRRATVTVGAILIGFGLVISSATIASSFKGSLDQYLERTVPADVLVTSTTEILTPSSMPMSPEVESVIRAVPGVEEVQRTRLVDVDVGGRRADVLAFEVEAWSRRAGFTMVSGSPDLATVRLARGEGVSVSENFANQRGFKVGDRLTVRTPRGPVTLPILGVFLDYTSAFGLIAMDRKLFDRFWDDRLVDMFDVYVKKGVDVRRVRDALDAAIGERYNAFVLTNADWKAKTRRMVDDSFALVRIQEMIAILVAILGLLNTLLIAVLERTREIGVLRAVGARRRQVAAAIVVEAALMGLAGAVLGVLLGAALSWVNVDVISVVHTGWRTEYRFAYLAAAQLFGLSLLTAAIAAWLPARRASRLNITEALEYE